MKTIKYKPSINNIDMNIENFIFSDGEFDYCIVNGESLTKYYGKKGGEYKSYSIHKFYPDSIERILTDAKFETAWTIELLKQDMKADKQLYKHYNNKKILELKHIFT